MGVKVSFKFLIANLHSNEFPARMIPYNSQNNDALIKELKFALKSVRE
jgi:hypothetical protein